MSAKHARVFNGLKRRKSARPPRRRRAHDIGAPLVRRGGRALRGGACGTLIPRMGTRRQRQIKASIVFNRTVAP